ncbi:proteoglycan 4b isoform X19 [Labeo rohita]|uniref:proteoglycan 4b isoform X18 n=1 Tax=Labeo rohita TaxID=84645 RepID=UPI0021E30A41|nr:proteoglycan 4b isoform X18 [Labeo rohita]XP_050994115.1 proteoglycan 4b isoform X19 [Labeo rohita]
MATYLPLLLLFAYTSTGSSDPNSCTGRCGEGYYKGNVCQCDNECMSLNECCTDFKELCTTKDSCKGRCGEPFHRAHTCHCDFDCVSYNQCCPDYENMCLVEETSSEDMTDGEEFGEAEEVAIPKDEDESEGLDASSMLPTDENPTEGPSSTAPTEGAASTAPTEGPSSTAPTEGAASTAPTEGPTTTASTEDPSSTAPTEGPSSTAPTEDPSSTASTEGPASTAPTEGPTTAASTEDPSSIAPTEGPSSVGPTEDPFNAAPTDGPSGAGPTEDPFNAAPRDGPSSAGPTEDPFNAAPRDGPSSAGPTEDPSSTAPTEGPSSAGPTEDPSSTAPTEGPSSVATPVPKKTLSTPAPTKKPRKPKRPTRPSKDKNDKPNSKESLKDPSSVAPIIPEENPLEPSFDKNGIKDYQADDYDTNLCSGRPVSGLTTLRNGTTVVFRGHYFWTLDKHRNPDPPQLITKVWGIPSPIDTVYTRCNCLGKTYFFKGKNYWRFENGVMDPGFPKPITQGFGQIDHITAALSIPEYRSRKESVIFFRRGGRAQKYTYQVTPSCGRKPRISLLTVRRRARRQAAAALGQVITISRTWKGFPTVVTSAVSVPSRVKEGYKYYVFSQNKYYSIKMEREKPAILKPAQGPKENAATSFFKCPATQKN